LYCNSIAAVTTRHKGKCIYLHDVNRSNIKQRTAENSSSSNYDDDDDDDDGETPLGAPREFLVLVKVLSRLAGAE
jgi:hypothetical protein